MKCMLTMHGVGDGGCEWVSWCYNQFIDNNNQQGKKSPLLPCVKTTFNLCDNTHEDMHTQKTNAKNNHFFMCQQQQQLQQQKSAHETIMDWTCVNLKYNGNENRNFCIQLKIDNMRGIGFNAIYHTSIKCIDGSQIHSHSLSLRLTRLYPEFFNFKLILRVESINAKKSRRWNTVKNIAFSVNWVNLVMPRHKLIYDRIRSHVNIVKTSRFWKSPLQIRFSYAKEKIKWKINNVSWWLDPRCVCVFYMFIMMCAFNSRSFK